VTTWATPRSITVRHRHRPGVDNGCPFATLVYTAGLWRGGAPRVPLALYAAAVFPIGLRALVPEAALQIALVVLAAAVVWLAVTLWQRGTAPATA
jgi:hypothetical protein